MDAAIGWSKDCFYKEVKELYSYKTYKVNTKSAMNANYVSDSSNKEAKTIDELKVVNHTLIKVTDGIITEYYEGEEITNKLS